TPGNGSFLLGGIFIDQGSNDVPSEHEFPWEINLSGPIQLLGNKNIIESDGTKHTLVINKTIFNTNWTGSPRPVTFQGTGLIVLGGSNTYGVNTTITENARVQVNNPQAFGTSNVTMANEATLKFGTDLLSLPNNIVLDSGTQANPGTATIDTGGFFSTLSGTITQAAN